MSLIFDKSAPGRNRIVLPPAEPDCCSDIPDELMNTGLDIVDVSEPDMVRYYTGLSRMNFGVDTGMYPLGSCTMKYNPKINEKSAALEGFTGAHPLAEPDCSQGALRLCFELARDLSALTGMSAFSLAPAAGSHGELTGVMIIKKYFEKKGEKRDTILIPDSAHGTNPASVAMCGFSVKEVKSTPGGDVDIDHLASLLDGSVAGMMLTSPNTLGLFDRNILAISEMLHKNGSLFYGDGANLNAVIGTAKMRDMGFDVMHINLHKTFSTPHGGGGPGAGPVGVADFLVPFLPAPVVECNHGMYTLDYDRPDSVGRMHSFYGNFLVLVKAYTYIRMLGFEGLREVSRTAVLNANYLMNSLKQTYNLPIQRTCMHEFVLNDKDIPNGVTTNDIAKRLLDYGFHAPTVYFPLLIPGAMMIEPTETESRESLDEFVRVMKRIRDEAEGDPELVKQAPVTTPVKRVDAVAAARKPVLKWEKK
ncbi:MAG TPA: aminomethyl-transferring glycine dehydrogenase subunit GcvPB [Spirochaetota bacterium]|nr:aminomethyl-transferring glycine dehydrogenase subunit GcvPB [Spirochaetota bacterium]HPI90995.1 aminomethyl-transferring glycine dehydrogenase subunit GcvPB [Spirochaetota bacterium]HPR46810.1 aminomethyl-transferring glycine dehydrogenase subunit GcvPB [Spirochaetota bacterium]